MARKKSKQPERRDPGPGAPSPAPANDVVLLGMSIHLAVAGGELACKASLSGKRTVVAAPFDHPAFCAACLAAEKTKVGATVPVMIRG